MTPLVSGWPLESISNKGQYNRLDGLRITISLFILNKTSWHLPVCWWRFIYTDRYICIYLPISLSIYQSIYQFTYFYLSIYLSTSLHLSTHLPWNCSSECVVFVMWIHFPMVLIYAAGMHHAADMPKAQPVQWEHADLEELREFLREEIRCGRYVPTLNLPL